MTAISSRRPRPADRKRPRPVPLNEYLAEGLAHLAADWDGRQAAADRARDTNPKEKS